MGGPVAVDQNQRALRIRVAQRLLHGIRADAGTGRIATLNHEVRDGSMNGSWEADGRDIRAG